MHSYKIPIFDPCYEIIYTHRLFTHTCVYEKVRTSISVCVIEGVTNEQEGTGNRSHMTEVTEDKEEFVVLHLMKEHCIFQDFQ